MTQVESKRIQFSFSSVESEIQTLEQIISDYIDKDSTFVLRRLREDLKNLRGAPEGRVRRWEVPANSPLKTAESGGLYEVGGGGSHHIWAEIDFAWDIEALGPNNINSLRHRKFAIDGIASTRIRLKEYDSNGCPRELAMWRMEIGDLAAPGCYIHIQVLGQEQAPPFPKSLPIPRLPAYWASPCAVIEFVIGELFQDDWNKEAARTSPNMDAWRAIQAKRLSKVFGWQQSVVGKTKKGSPWMALKKTYPPSDIFL